MLRTTLLLAGLVIMSGPAEALTMKECGENYQAARKAGTLGGKGWSEFRAQSCASAAAAGSAEAGEAAPSPASQPSAKAGAPSGAVFPTALSPAFATERPTRARLHTCLEQYRANKKTGGNAGLKWIAKGGGYYSQCSRRLRG
jgi:hypothetical protein